jgi:hypothetical protein
MALDKVTAGDGSLLPAYTRVDGADTTKAVEGLTDFLVGTTPTTVSAANPLPVTSASLPLPSGASTETTLASLNAKVTAVNTGAVAVASSVLPTGASTEATLASLNAKVTAVNTGSVTVASSALPSGAATESTLAAMNAKTVAIDTGAVVLAAGSAIVGRVGFDHTTPGVTDGVVADITEIGGASLTLGQKTMATSLPVVLASDQAAIPVTGSFSATPADNVVISASTISAVGSTAWFSTTGYPVIAIALTGNWAGNVQINGSHDQVRPDPLLVQETNGAYIEDEIIGPGLYFVRSITPFIQINTTQLVGTITYSIVGKSGMGPDSLSILSQAIDPASTVNLNVNVAKGLAKDANNSLFLSDCRTIPVTLAVGSSVIIDTIGYQSVQVTSGALVASVGISNDTALPFTTGILTLYMMNGGAQLTTINANNHFVFPVVARFLRITATTAGSATFQLRNTPLTLPIGSTPVLLNGINGANAPVTAGVNGVLAVGGNIAPGAAQTTNPLVVGGIDANSLTRRLSVDTAGRIVSPSQLLPSQSLLNVAPLNVLDVSNHEKIPNSELLWQILTELKIHSYYLSQMPAMLNSPYAQYGFPESEEPAALRNQPQDLDHPVSN